MFKWVFKDQLTEARRFCILTDVKEIAAVAIFNHFWNAANARCDSRETTT